MYSHLRSSRQALRALAGRSMYSVTLQRRPFPFLSRTPVFSNFPVLFAQRGFSTAVLSRETASDLWRDTFIRENRIEGVTMVKDISSARRAVSVIKKNANHAFAWDTETEMLPSKGPGLHCDTKLLCLTCYGGDDIDFGHGPFLWVDVSGCAQGVLAEFQEVLEDSRIRKVFHNFSFDYSALLANGIRVRGLEADTLHLARLVDSSLAGWEARVSCQKRERAAALEELMSMSVDAIPNIEKEGENEKQRRRVGRPRKVTPVYQDLKEIDHPTERPSSAQASLSVESPNTTTKEVPPPPPIRRVDPFPYSLKSLMSKFLAPHGKSFKWTPGDVPRPIQGERERESAGRTKTRGPKSRARVSSGALKEGEGQALSDEHLRSDLAEECVDADEGEGEGEEDDGRWHQLKELFGKANTEEIHNCTDPAVFTRWVRYGCEDVWGAFHLYVLFRSTLEGREWNSEVVASSSSEGTTMTSGQGGKRGREGKNGFSGSEMSRNASKFTGRNMWDFVKDCWTPFGESLCRMEERGMRLDSQTLNEACVRAERRAQDGRRAFVEWAGSVQGPSGRRLNPYASLMNLNSSKQLRTFLFGSTEEWEGQINLKTSEHIPGELLVEEKNTAGWRVPLKFKRERSVKRAELLTGDRGETVLFPSDEGGEGGTKEKERDYCDEEELFTPSSVSFEIRGLGLRLEGPGLGRQRALFTPKGWPKISRQILEALAGDTNEGEYGAAFEQVRARLGEEEATAACRALAALHDSMRSSRVLSSILSPLRDRSNGGRVHASFAPDTATGRLVCRRPNLQNQPASSRDIFKIRDAFTADSGKTLLVADYSQLELRVLAHLSGCKKMIEKLEKKGDLHSETAVEVFPHVKEALESGEVVLVRKGEGGPPSVQDRFHFERSAGKVINFSIAYGKTAETLAEDLNVDPETASGYMDRWYETNWEVFEWKKRTIANAKQTLTASSLLGRQRYLPHIRDWSGFSRLKSERAAVNHCVQGSAADLVMAAMLRVENDREMGDELGFRLVLQVHDELVLEGPAENAEKARRRLVALMAHPFADWWPNFSFRVPLEVDAKIGTSWFQAKKQQSHTETQAASAPALVGGMGAENGHETSTPSDRKGDEVHGKAGVSVRPVSRMEGKGEGVLDPEDEDGGSKSILRGELMVQNAVWGRLERDNVDLQAAIASKRERGSVVAGRERSGTRKVAM